MHSCILTLMLPGRWDACQKEVNQEDDIPTGKYTDSRNPLNLTQTTGLRNWSWIYKNLPKFTLLCFSLCPVFSIAITTDWAHLIMACGELCWVDIKQSGSWLVWDAFVGRVLLNFPVGISSSRQHTCSCAALCEISRFCYPNFLPTSTLHHCYGCVVYLFRQLGRNWVSRAQRSYPFIRERKSWSCF